MNEEKDIKLEKEKLKEEPKEEPKEELKEEKPKGKIKKEIENKKPILKSHTKKKIKTSKKKFVILNIIGDKFVLKDIHGNGIKIPISKELEKAQIGDTIYL